MTTLSLMLTANWSSEEGKGSDLRISHSNLNGVVDEDEGRDSDLQLLLSQLYGVVGEEAGERFSTQLRHRRKRGLWELGVTTFRSSWKECSNITKRRMTR